MGAVGLCCVHGPIALFKRKEINEKMDPIYIVMRREGTRTDGYYYESVVTIIGLRDDPAEASELLKAAAICFHKDEKPCRGTYDKYGDTEIVYGDLELEDEFWIEKRYIYIDHLPGPWTDYIKKKGD